MVDETRIREKAYELWEQAGHPDDKHEDHWQQATDSLEAEESPSDATSGGVESGVAPPSPIPAKPEV